MILTASSLSAQPGRLPGDTIGIKVTQGGDLICASDQLDFSTSQFLLTKAGNTCTIDLAALVTQRGSVIGDDPNDFGNPINFGTTTLDGDSSTNIFSTVIGSVASQGVLTLDSTTSGTPGTIDILDQVKIHDAVRTITPTGAYNILTLQSNSLTINAGSAPTLRGVLFNGPITYGTDPASTGMGAMFNFASTVTNSGSRTFYPFTVFAASPKFEAATSTTLNGASWIYRTLLHNPNIATSSGATNTLVRVSAVESLGTGTEIGTSSVTDWIGLYMVAPTITGGDMAITNISGIRLGDLKTGDASEAAAFSLWSTGATTNMRHAGAARFGEPDADPAAATTMHVTSNVAGDAVLRLDTDLTTDPIVEVRQNRITTTDATETTLATVTIANSTAVQIEAHVAGRCTSGAGCTAGNGGAWTVVGVFRAASGTAAQIPDANGDDVIAASEDTDIGAAVPVLLDVSGATARVRVTGETTDNMTWHATLYVYPL